MKTKSCHCCEGSGKEFDHRAVGAEMRKLRLSRRVSQSEIARRLGFTPPYICDLEQGDRNWRLELIVAYKKACDK